MPSKSDSDATYCSEAENMTKLTEIATSVDQPKRRSQRLSQKSVRHFWHSASVFQRNNNDFSQTKPRKVNVSPHNCNTLTQAVFSPADIREDQEANDVLALNQKSIKVSQKHLTTSSQAICSLRQNDEALTIQEKSVKRIGRREGTTKSPTIRYGNSSAQIIFSSTEIKENLEPKEFLPLNIKSLTVSQKHADALNRKSRSEPFLKTPPPSQNVNTSSSYAISAVTKKQNDFQDILLPQEKSLKRGRKRKSRSIANLSKRKKFPINSIINDGEASLANAEEQNGVPLDLSMKKSEESLKTSNPVEVNDNILISIANTSKVFNVTQGTFGSVANVTDGNDDQHRTQLATTDIKDLSVQVGGQQQIYIDSSTSIPVIIKSDFVQDFKFQSEEERPIGKTPGTSGTISQTKRRKAVRRRKPPAKTQKRKAKKSVAIGTRNKPPKEEAFQYSDNFYELMKFTEKRRRTQELSKTSMLPDIYPPHFKYQLPPEAVLTQPLIPPQPGIMTPDETQSFDLKDSTSTSPSLPESLREIFDTDDLRHLLDIEKVTYRLYDYHIKALALVLNVRDDYLHAVLNKILKINPNVLRKISLALNTPFVQDHDLFERTTSTDIGSQSNEAIPNSGSSMGNGGLPVTQTKRRKLC